MNLAQPVHEHRRNTNDPDEFNKGKANMPPKYKILLCLSILVVFLILYRFNGEEKKLTSKMKYSHVSKAKKSKIPANFADNNNMVAAILVMPKYYLPALAQFSNSAMAKNITILRAELESKDGQMTAVYKKDGKRGGRKITQANKTPSKTKGREPTLAKTPKREKQVLAAGFIYFLANLHKSAIFR